MNEIRETVSPYIYNVLVVLAVFLWVLFVMGNVIFGAAMGSVPLFLALILRKLNQIQKGI